MASQAAKATTSNAVRTESLSITLFHLASMIALQNLFFAAVSFDAVSSLWLVIRSGRDLVSKKIILFRNPGRGEINSEIEDAAAERGHPEAKEAGEKEA